MQKCFLIIVVWFSLVCSSSASAQQMKRDSAYIKPFEKQNVIELFPGIYHTKFDFTNPGSRGGGFKMVANSSGYAGFFFNYKWLSVENSFAVPGTYLDKQTKLKYNSLHFQFYTGPFMIRPYYNSYNGLLIPYNRNRYTADRNILFKEAGTELLWCSNASRFSLREANAFSEQQLKSAGGFIVKATPLWQQLQLKNTDGSTITDVPTSKLFSTSPRWISLTARVGYNYSFVFSNGKWTVSPAVLVGKGVLKELNQHTSKFSSVSGIQSWINTGYNGAAYYVYFSAAVDDLQTNLILKNMHQLNTDFSVTAGLRFANAKHKLLGIL